MKALLTEYNAKEETTFEDILDFHVKFKRIHPFQDDNGRVGRLIMFKECLKYNIVPFIIEDNLKLYYYRGLKEWNKEKGFLNGMEKENIDLKALGSRGFRQKSIISLL